MRIGENIASRLLEFSVGVVRLVKQVDEPVLAPVIKQLVKAATSPGANYEEARAAESRADFIHKVGIAHKELREAIYWLRLASAVASIDANHLIREGQELSAILGRSVLTARGVH